MLNRTRFVVIDAGSAGSAAATSIIRRAAHASTSRRGADGPIEVVIGCEPWVPYNRTAVNKGLLTGAVTDDEVALHDIDTTAVQWRTAVYRVD